MSVFFYIISMFLSASTGIITTIMMFSEEDSAIFRAFGNKEILFILGCSLVLLIIGFISDYKEREEL